MTPEEQRYREIGQREKDALSSQMFGKPCFKVSGKAFIAFFQNCAVFKLPTGKREEALALQGAVLFDPSGKGRPMKEWIQLPFEHAGMWEVFAAAAYDYVKTTSA